MSLISLTTDKQSFLLQCTGISLCGPLSTGHISDAETLRLAFEVTPAAVLGELRDMGFVRPFEDVYQAYEGLAAISQPNVAALLATGFAWVASAHAIAEQFDVQLDRVLHIVEEIKAAEIRERETVLRRIPVSETQQNIMTSWLNAVERRIESHKQRIVKLYEAPEACIVPDKLCDPPDKATPRKWWRFWEKAR